MTSDVDRIVEQSADLFRRMESLALPERVEALNRLRVCLSELSPFATEPVDCVQWVHAESVGANAYNPNSVAPPEMELLRRSIMADGYTQPIVSMRIEGSDMIEVVDGFHRNRVGKECDDVRERVHGYLPVVSIRTEQAGLPDRMAATVRHNRARGKHSVEGMSEIVLELRRRNWSDKKIGKELGMDEDEVLRLCQIQGMAEAWGDREFSEAWEAIEDGAADTMQIDNLDDAGMAQ